MVGWSDLPADLSDQPAIDRLAAFLPEAPVLSSDLLRATQTADAIAMGRQRLGRARALREIHFGAWELRSFAEVEAESPDHIRAYWEQPGDIAPPGGESWNAVEARVNAHVDQMAQEAGHRDVIAVAHMGVILTQLRRARAQTAYEAFGQKIDNLSVTCLRFDGGRWHEELVNHRP